MSTTPAPGDDGFHVVVADDGSVPAAELARLGVRPGAHLRVVPEPRNGAHEQRATAFGYLADVIGPDAADALLSGIEHGKADRIEALGLS